jgi:hypothetical protein
MRRRTSVASANPTISASAVCRLGMAAYAFAAIWTRLVPWLSHSACASVSVSPGSGMKSRWCGRHRDVADEAERVRDDDDGVEKHPRLDDRSLDVTLEEGAEPLLDAADPVRVCERFGRPAVRETSGDLVRDDEAEPDRKLAQEVAASARESEGPGRRRSSHRGFEDPFRSLENCHREARL